MMMIERLLIAIIVAGLAVAAYQLFRRWQVRRAARVARRDPLLAALRPGSPAILYFTTPTCVPCTTQQRPALARLREELGSALQVIEVDAQQHPDAADRWGVLSVPTTVILDGSGQPRQINHGVASADKLRRQLQSVGTGGGPGSEGSNGHSLAA